VVILMVLVKEKIVETRFISKIIGILRQDSCIDLIQFLRIYGGRLKEF
jgi:hypothetical protein